MSADWSRLGKRHLTEGKSPSGDNVLGEILMIHTTAATRRGLRASTALSALLLIEAGLLATPAWRKMRRQRTSATPAVRLRSNRDVGAGRRVENAQDIIVTGSRIPQPNLESAAPVTVVSDQDVKLVRLDPDRRRAQPVAVRRRGAGSGDVERRDGNGRSRPSLPRFEAHAGAGQRPSHDAGRSERHDAGRPTSTSFRPR